VNSQKRQRVVSGMSKEFKQLAEFIRRHPFKRSHRPSHIPLISAVFLPF
jgi:hypothetical protein